MQEIMAPVDTDLYTEMKGMILSIVKHLAAGHLKLCK